jgi:ribosomal protein S18 acetylase RimI-like enzyme
MKLVRWKRFTWDLTQLPATESAPLHPYTVRAAFGDDSEAVAKIILSAFTLDPAWSDTFANIREWLSNQIVAAFEREAAPAVVISHGQRIIAASAMSTDVEADTHLISGPCVSMEYRNRGLGTALLYHTLSQLRQAGLRKVQGITKDGISATKFVYPKFSSTAEDYEFHPELVRT